MTGSAAGHSEPERDLSAHQRAIYDALRRRPDLDAVHDLIARYGPEVLDKGLPYMVVSARNRLRSLNRRAVTTSEVFDREVSAVPDRSAMWDPLARAVDQDELRRLVIALANCDDRDVLVLWRNAQGVSDSDIAREWDQLEYEPKGPSPDYLAKRRERVRRSLRRALDRT